MFLPSAGNRKLATITEKRTEEMKMSKYFWKAILGDDIPAIVVGPFVFWAWPLPTVATRGGAVQRMGGIRPA